MSSTKDVKYVKYGNRTEEEWKAVQEERRPEVYELLNRLGYTHKADIANLKIYQSANGFDIQDGITDQVYGAIIKDAALKGVLTNNQGSTLPPSAPASDSATNYADAYKSSAYANASALRGASYEAALKARQESEALAEIQRKRGVVDASTMAEQQKATYGANAEQLGRMGLNVSGYSDYLNSQAYANGMAYRQAANAQATDIKRQATYQEALARLEADKAYSQATAEADKTYYGAMKEIEAAKIADAKAKEQQQQTKFGKLIDAIVNGNGVINKDNVATYASALGITDTKLLDDAKNFATTYGENTPKTLTETEIQQINNAYDAAIQDGDYITAGDKYIEGTHYTASEEQKKTYLASFMVENITNVDDSQWKTIADKIAKGDYGTKGGERIKEAFSNSEYVSSAESLGKNELKAVIDSGLLTEEAQSKLESLYATKFAEKNQTSAYSTDVFGKYSNPEKVSAAQSDYADAIVEAAKNGKINEGDIVAVVLNSNSQKYYKYVGGNKFEEVSDTMVKYSSDANVVTIDGYEITREDKGSTVPYYSWKVTKKK